MAVVEIFHKAMVGLIFNRLHRYHNQGMPIGIFAIAQISADLCQSGSYNPISFFIAMARRFAAHIRSKTCFELPKTTLRSVIGSQNRLDFGYTFRCTSLPKWLKPSFIQIQQTLSDEFKNLPYGQTN